MWMIRWPSDLPVGSRSNAQGASRRQLVIVSIRGKELEAVPEVNYSAQSQQRKGRGT
jgi:hypothetical protein